ncbi:MAG: AraC family transcriptional regulator [Paenibacillus sp.]|nr:AraC family transcriptional regulator [Paenibacillus sp.]
MPAKQHAHMERLEAAKWKEAAAALNAVAQRLTGAKGAYEIMYWGASPGLLANQYHKHSFYEICLCTRGGGTYRENEERYRIEPGVAFCSRPEVYHQIVPDPDQELYLLFVAFLPSPGTLPPEAADAFGHLRAEGPALIREAAGTAAAHLWLALLQTAASGLLWEKSAELLKGIAYSLLLAFPALFAEERLHRSVVAPAGTIHTIALQAGLYIRDNLAEPLFVKHIADYLHLSERHLSRIFEQEHNISVGDYIRQERVRSAEELLRQGELSIKEIARQTGFGSVHYFSRIFRRETGWSPAAYRRSSARPDRFFS